MKEKSNQLQTQFTKDTESPGFLFWKTANLHQRLQRLVLADLEITPSQFSVLACYFFLSHEGPPTQASVCAQSGLDKMHVSDITKALAQKKLLNKKDNPEDRRSSLVELTPKGKMICNKAIKLVESLDLEFFSASGDLTLLKRMLRKIQSKYNPV